MASALHIVRSFFPEVETVVDATRSVTVEVTGRDVASKAVKNHNACAMAVACKRALNLDGVVISRSTAYLVKGRRAKRYIVPPSVAREVVSFDRGGGFAPGRYKLSPVPEGGRLGTRTGSATDSGRGGVTRKFRHITSNIRTALGGKKPEDE